MTVHVKSGGEGIPMDVYRCCVRAKRYCCRLLLMISAVELRAEYIYFPVFVVVKHVLRRGSSKNILRRKEAIHLESKKKSERWDFCTNRENYFFFKTFLLALAYPRCVCLSKELCVWFFVPPCLRAQFCSAGIFTCCWVSVESGERCKSQIAT